ncbi:two-component system sensor histidine kinase NtrB [Sneathiella glossodoripedis]|uniref:two-component system sensor histidine kinase NtrB n=1 Tax=Sneathiella glossodoripedis TaxID=418853 RepID=UPI00046F454F|nr:PAS domain-containing hybrid sensor histidine kinase/response regulator [Sneathiella glossodoripedis]
MEKTLEGISDSSIIKTTSYHETCSRICNGLLIALSVLAVPALITSVSRVNDLGWQPVMSVHVVSAFVLWIVTFYRRKLSFNIRASIVCVLIYMSGFAGLYSLGRLSAGEVWFVIFPTVVTVFFGLRYGVIAIFLTAIGGILIAYLYVSGIKEVPIISSDYLASPFGWWSLIFGILISTSTATVAIGMLSISLVRSIKESDHQLVENQKEISRRKSLEDALRQSEARIRALIEHAPEAITLIDASTGHYVYVNPTAEKLHGLSKQELVGKMGPAAISPKYQADGQLSKDIALKYLQKALDGNCQRFEWLHVKPDGTEFPCEVSLSRLPDPNLDLIRACIIDITERKKAENDRAVLEAELFQAHKMETVGQLTAGMAHDFNNLLTIVLGNAEILQMTVGEDNKQLNTILNRVDLGAKSVQRLLAFSRKQELKPSILDVNSLLSDVKDAVVEQLPTNVEFKMNLDPALWSCEVDSTHLENAIINLVVNAKDAMPDGGMLTIETTNVDLRKEHLAKKFGLGLGQYIEISVNDTGTGMPESIQKKVLEPFFTTKEVGAGTGLGLSMVYGFTQQSGGNTVIESEQGIGTSIKLLLPKG